MNLGAGVNKLMLAAASIPLLGLVLGILALAFMGGTERITPSGNALAPWEASFVDSDTMEDERALLERPLLWASRRPIPPPEPVLPVETPSESEAAPVKSALEGYRLAGIFQSDFDAGVIIVGPKERKRMVIGDTIDGWMLEQVRSDDALFVNGGSRSSKARAVIKPEHMLPAAGNQGARGTSTNAPVNKSPELNADAAKTP
jgi:hypothetical protein